MSKNVRLLFYIFIFSIIGLALFLRLRHELEQQRAYQKLIDNHVTLYEWRGGLNGLFGIEKMKWFARPIVASAMGNFGAAKAIRESLPSMQSITALGVFANGGTVDSDFLEVLFEIKGLKSLTLSDFKLSDKGWSSIGHLSSLTLPPSFIKGLRKKR